MTGNWGEFTALYDSVSLKIYRPQNNLTSHSAGMTYLDCRDWTFKSQPVGSMSGSSNCRSGFIDPVHRLLVLVDTGLTRLIAFQMDDNGVVNAAPTVLARSTNSVTLDNTGLGLKGKWAFSPVDGCHFMMFGWGTDNFLYRVRPPSSSPLTSAWEVTRHAIRPEDGRALPVQSSSVMSSNAQHCSRLFWNNALGCLAWIPGNGDGGSRSAGQRVYLIRPPAA
jgi:hypothetical protein